MMVCVHCGFRYPSADAVCDCRVRPDPPKMVIHTRFNRRMKASTRDDDVCVMRADLSQVPSVGELVSLKGNPYIVVERSWSMGEASLDDAYSQYAFVVVVPAGNWPAEEPR